MSVHVLQVQLRVTSLIIMMPTEMVLKSFANMWVILSVVSLETHHANLKYYRFSFYMTD